MQSTELDNRLTRYLLGDLAEQDRTQLEDEYLSSAESFDELLVAEDELIDDYVRDRLSRRDRRLFEEHFLTSPARAERVKSARALMNFADARAQTAPAPFTRRVRSGLGLQSTIFRFALAAGFLVLLVGGAIMAIQIRKLNSELNALRSQQLAQSKKAGELEQLLAEQKQQNESFNASLERERGERGQLEQQVAKLNEQQRQVQSVTFALGFGNAEKSKGTPPEPTTLKLPRRAEIIKLQLDLFKNDFENYLVVLQDATQREVWRGVLHRMDETNGRSLVVRIPSRVLTSGPHKLLLSGARNNKDFVLVSEFNLDVARQ